MEVPQWFPGATPTSHMLNESISTTDFGGGPTVCWDGLVTPSSAFCHRELAV